MAKLILSLDVHPELVDGLVGIASACIPDDLFSMAASDLVLRLAVHANEEEHPLSEDELFDALVDARERITKRWSAINKAKRWTKVRER